MKPFRYGLTYVKPVRTRLLICHFLGFLGVSLGQSLPLLSSFIIDGIINYNGTAPKNTGVFSFLCSGIFGDFGTMNLLINTSILFVSIAMLRSTIFYIRNVSYVEGGFTMERNLRHDTYEKMLKMSNSSLSKYNTGEMLTVMHNDIVSFKELYTGTLLAFSISVYRILYDIVMLINISAYMLLVPIILAPLFIIVMRKYLRAAKKVSQNIRDRNSDLNLTVTEDINAIRLIRAYTNEEYETNKFRKRNEAVKDSYLDHTVTISKYNAIFNALRQAAYVGAIALCTYFIVSGSLLAGSLVACTSYVMMIMSDITSLNSNSFVFQQYMVSVEKINKFMDEEEVGFRREPVALNNVDITIRDMCVEENGQKLLDNINIDIPYGKKIGVMGATGSGKSVLLKTLSYIIPYTSGSIKLSGKEITEFDLEELRAQFSYVFQDVFLFSNTIDANIAFSKPDVAASEIEAAAKNAVADSFIKKMPQGYDTIVGEKGIGLSGGQRQRISIARAIIKDAPILILDDATSALDTETEKELLANIKEKYPLNTLLIASHKVSAVKDCDEIIFLADGKIAERGTLSELVDAKGLFFEVYTKQNEERLDDECIGGE